MTHFFGFNEILFITQNIIIAAFSVLASRFGKIGLASFAMMCAILGNVLVQKQVMLFGLDVISSDGYPIGYNSVLLMLALYYGPKAPRTVIMSGFVLTLFFIAMIKIHLMFIPSIYDLSEAHYQFLFDPMIRILCTGIFVGFLSTHLNLYLNKFFSLIMPVSIANISSIGLSQVADTTLFAFLALYGKVHAIYEIIFFSIMVKFVAIGINSVVVQFVQRYLPKPYDAL